MNVDIDDCFLFKQLLNIIFYQLSRSGIDSIKIWKRSLLLLYVKNIFEVSLYYLYVCFYLLSEHFEFTDRLRNKIFHNCLCSLDLFSKFIRGRQQNIQSLPYITNFLTTPIIASSSRDALTDIVFGKIFILSGELNNHLFSSIRLTMPLIFVQCRQKEPLILD